MITFLKFNPDGEVVPTIIDKDVYFIIPIVTFTVGRKSNLFNLLTDPLVTGILGIELKWGGSYLESVPSLEEIAKEKFKTPHVGIIYHVNRHEPDVAMDALQVKPGDRVELAYINRDWEKK